MAKKKKKNNIFAILVKIVLGIGIFTLLIIVPFRWIAPPTSSFILQSEYSSEPNVPNEIQHEWVYWEEISPSIAIAVVAAEDQNFPIHNGFDFESISKALSERVKRTRGASTITQQVVKNLYLWPGKSFLRKGIEAYLTLFVELFWPKKRILEIYLNFAEFGRGIYGVEAASLTFFNKHANVLTLREASLLAAVLPSPKRMSPKNPSAYVQKRAEWIMKQVKQLNGPAYLNDL